MLVDYDAKSIADVMGVAFLRGPQRPPSPGNAGAGAGSKRLAGADVHDMVVDVVEARTNDTLDTPTQTLIERAVEHGLPRTALRHVAEWLAGGDKAKASTLEWGVVPKTTLERRATQLSTQESERTERIARLSVHASRALGSQDEARAFMTTSHPELDGRTPVEVARTDLGTRRTEQILNALEYGLAL